MVQTIIEWVKAAGIVIAAVSLYLAYRQFRTSVRWNRINATFTYLPETIYLERERAAATALEAIGVDLYKQEEPLAHDVVKRILEDTQVYKEAKDFINLFEDYATAYKANAIDRNLSYKLSASQFIRYYKMFKPLIDGLRHQLNNQMYWREFERLVTKDWQPRRIKEIEDFERKKDKDHPEYG